MAATEYEYLKGKCSWASLTKPNKYNKWSLQLYPDPESLAKIRELQAEGVKNLIKKDEDGWFVRLGRPCEIQLRTGKKVGMSPPEVLDGSKPLPDGGYAPLTEYVGNGSDVVVKMEVYSYKEPVGGKRVKAMRLLSVRVDTLVPYQKASFDDHMERSQEGMDKQAKQTW